MIFAPRLTSWQATGSLFFMIWGVSKSGLIHNTIFHSVIVVAGKLIWESDVLLRLSVEQHVGDS